MKKFEISDNESILIEFINESRQISVGYKKWILSDKNMESLIETKEIVEILWPKNQEVVAEKKMKKIFQKNPNLIWSPYAVKILACGGMY